MKRFLSCLCLVALCPLAMAGCGDDSSSDDGDGSEDGGVDPTNLGTIRNDIDDLDESVSMLGDDLEGLGGDLDSLREQLEGSDSDLSDRLDELQDAVENPDILSCSEEELCIPDGLMITTSSLADIVSNLCELEVGCCDPNELNYKFGPSITTVEDCENLFTDLVNNGFSPEFLGEGGWVISQIIHIVQLLNDPSIAIELNDDGIEECVDSLGDRECPKYEEGEVIEETCVPPAESTDDDPCSIKNLITGKQIAGEKCGNFGEYEFLSGVPQCEEGLHCARQPDGSGICAEIPVEGSRCRSDSDCGTSEYGYGTTALFCNKTNGECQEFRGEGDDCTYVNPRFNIAHASINPSPFTSYHNNALKVDCAPGYVCDPEEHQCVSPCSEGTLCRQNADCPADTVCNFTQVENLYETWALGRCTAILEQGDPCTHLSGTECDTGRCIYDAEDARYECGAPLKDVGDECDFPGAADATCSTGYCDLGSACAQACDCEGDQDCDQQVDEFGTSRPCESSHYCSFSQQFDVNPDPQIGDFAYLCQPKIANGTACALSNGHSSCTSGFCNPETTQCAPKVAANAACTSGATEECPSSQYCSFNSYGSVYTCRTYVAADGSCAPVDNGTDTAYTPVCNRDLVCVNATTCEEYAQEGEECSGTNPPCEPGTGLGCYDLDGPGDGTELNCLNALGGFPIGTYCYATDSYCASGWCRPDDNDAPTTYLCAEPLAEGDDCDVDDETQDVCEEGTFCKHPLDDSAGECSPKGRTGEECDPSNEGQDCLDDYFGSCVFSNDQFVCDSYARPLETEFCDGED